MRVKVVQSNLFESLDSERFDLILDDVSGMAEECSKISPWFAGGIPSGGYDGTDVTVAMLHGAQEHLNEDGRLYFPVLSLSDADKILQQARNTYGRSLEMIAEKWIPFCKEFKDSLSFLEELKNKGIIDYITKRSRQLWHLQIYRANAALA
ncbi:MAG: hypothetical protein AAF492_06225 [Verrucomicrobiota bacterium]